MKSISQWILLNPSAVKAYLVAVLALIAKLILIITGKTADLGVWSAFVEQAIDLLVGGLSIYGVIAGSIHVSRGDSPTAVTQAAAIVSVLEPAPVAVAVEQVKAVVADVAAAAKAPAPETVETPHRF